MSVLSLSIIQDNVSLGIDLLSIHNPLSFIVEALYTDNAPTTCNCSIYDKDDILLGNFSCIPYKDVLNNRQFVFVADNIINSYMESFDDVTSPEQTVHELPNFTKYFKLVFTCESVSVFTEFRGAHAVQQFGQTPQLEEVFNNASMTFYGCENKPVYIYFYNTTEGASISVNTEFAEIYAADYDLTLFIDDDNVLFLIE